MRILLGISVFLFSLGAFSQPYGNGWIQYDRPHYRIKVYEDGIYRVSYESLQSAGIPVSSIGPNQLQLFGKEAEQALHIEGGDDGSLDPGDFIEFFGEGNDGWLDSLLFSDPSKMGNPHYSLVNDTIHYFLTWNTDSPHERFEIESGTDYNNYLSPGYLWHTVRQVNSSQYSFGQLLSFSNNTPDFVEGEGWMGGRFGLGTNNLNQAAYLQTTNAVSSGAPNAIGSTRFSSANNSGELGDNHHIKVFRGDGNQVQLADITFQGYRTHEVNFTMSAGQVADETLIDHVVIDDLDIAADQFRVGFTELSYAHNMDLGDMSALSFRVEPNSSQDKFHLSLDGVLDSMLIIYGLGPSSYRVRGTWENGHLDFLLPNQDNGRSRVFIADESDIHNVGLEKVTETGFFTDYTSLAPDSAFIIIAHPSLMQSAETYASYRANALRDAVTVDVEELYDQFGGGIPKHFLSIRRFCELVVNNWDSAPAHLFLIGKSVFFEPQNNFNGNRKDAELYAQCLIPSYGSPGSDLLYTSGLNSPSITPVIPVGRLSAFTNDEVLDYLNKVVYNESRDAEAWMKNVLHFGGGSIEAEQQRFAGYLSNYQEIIEDTCFGGNVSTFLKESSLPIVVNLSDSISDIIEEGVSIITFFGHAGGGQFDQSIDEPQNLDWGAHPHVIVNSCFSGDIHQPNHGSTSEEYVIIPGKGAIGFIASVQQGLEGYLDAYSTELFKQISRKNYGRSIGYLMQQTIDSLGQAGFTQGDARASLMMNLLQGDPAVPVFSPDRPDLYIDETSVSFFPEVVTALDDSIQIQVVVTNIGKATTSSFGIELKRILPGGNEVVYQESLPSLYFRDTVTFDIPTDFTNGFGVNTFEVQVDLPNNVVPESDNFLNNRTSKTLPITDGGVFPIYPFEFAIIPHDQVTLKASTGSPFIEERSYQMQLDTTDLFNSPFLQDFQIDQSGGVVNWDVPITLSDSTVYYWQVAETEDNPEEMDWRESSFQYIEEQTGWGQSHFFQFKDDRFNTLFYDRPERDVDFLTGTKLLSCEVFGNSFINETAEYFIDFQSVDYDGCSVTEAFHVAVIDPITLEPWGTRYGGENPNHFFGNANDNGSCRPRVEYYFIFRQNNAEQMSGFMNMIENEVPDGHIVLIYSWRYGRPAWWTPEIPALFDDLGASDVASIDENLPFIFIGVKGDLSQSIEVVGDTINSYIELSYDMPVSGNSGSMLSQRIGPAQEWNSLHWKGTEIDPSDSATISLIGINSLGIEEEILGGIYDIAVEDVLQLDEVVDAAQYPFIKLKAYFRDPLELDPVQLPRWQLLYTPVPEAALNPLLAYEFHGDTIQEGEELRLVSTIENISELDMDSLLVRYWVETNNNDIIPINYPLQAPLLAGSLLTDTLTLNTFGLSGANTLWVEANPVNPATGDYDQLEQYHFNNLGQLRFNVNEDRINPILDVTFDGVHILDGDLISAKPEVLIRLDDENPFLLMDSPSDTSFFSVFLTDPNGVQQRIYFSDGAGNDIMNFMPATGSSNVADILFHPDLELDGTYRLMVIASDKSGNASGNVNYQTRFSVEHAMSITEVLNYPNPFSTRTKFVFTLTGTSVPDFMKIQIMTVTGNVVREIFKEELGNLHIGRNVTDFAWDGTDQYGDPLANGVYLYRVIVKDSDQDVDVRATAASSFFKKGFGKMYLMR